ncbi:23S rRNA (pseudouridine(1915)-N(3))-methyltransferase RlmH [Rhodoblastus acidophilus]|uniref:Ribosomal RNA large subunit methyltransferase H n=1 Tax=Candidatus Rhodoblastus alkanivorans TaxID=2954117 RepID=A0ABS9Z3T0_9HYPH|nr:23S rRNA (pseudouridine(1915)-N(3))-methyltransferase RlmH [Candidatus Rhodoblastus alkanivorans]MCI4679951.1 23S rRNA (pseudouridine(1915)-N(3))-methyltransferase RlmH [Candidatus Rhodoblastus alkanivorans]MCI4682334.1 23S rRNA (pseudouridine(1915)-N(3))-methyltransferase RlmH [Candidatus Rhodoblastus alkanivorans]MDI4639637.1 23S rRNA (pseudouridine(1915)-N(3))-methyltransferase RlmH [Rhodoblastus acidophilus]
MKLLLIGVGRLKAGPERELVARYVERCVASGRKIGFGGFDLREIDESRARRPEDRKAEEAAALSALLPQGARKICLDERGRNMTSEDFAQRLGEWRDGGSPVCALAIGGPDGLDPAFRDRADLTLAFGAMTWPHQIVRALAAEQLFRALTILSGHPYHRV